MNICSYVWEKNSGEDAYSVCAEGPWRKTATFASRPFATAPRDLTYTDILSGASREVYACITF
jgi:rubredoxin